MITELKIMTLNIKFKFSKSVKAFFLHGQHIGCSIECVRLLALHMLLYLCICSKYTASDSKTSTFNGTMADKKLVEKIFSSQFSFFFLQPLGHFKIVKED